MTGHHRRRPAHHQPIEHNAHSVIVFVTVCAKRRQPVLANERVHRIMIAAWNLADNWFVGRYVILPDHVHLFCAPNRVDVPPTRWVHFWKSEVTRRWPNELDKPIWQPDFWDTQLRLGDSYEAKWEYVRNNPVRHGLVDRPEKWPYAGELNVLAWD